MEAQRFPDDYDGIVAGAPANFWTHLVSGAAWNNQNLLTDPVSYIVRQTSGNKCRCAGLLRCPRWFGCGLSANRHNLF